MKRKTRIYVYSIATIACIIALASGFIVSNQMISSIDEVQTIHEIETENIENRPFPQNETDDIRNDIFLITSVLLINDYIIVVWLLMLVIIYVMVINIANLFQTIKEKQTVKERIEQLEAVVYGENGGEK
jgi:hypothetical protein